MATTSSPSTTWTLNIGDIEGRVPESGAPPPDGLPRTARFLAADPDHTTAIFKRFHEASVRNLLFLEARVAALQEAQEVLDDLRPSDPDIKFANRAPEILALLGSSGGRDAGGVDIPRFVLEYWARKLAGGNYKPDATLREIQNERERLMSGGLKPTSKGSPNVGAEQPPVMSSTMMDTIPSTSTKDHSSVPTSRLFQHPETRISYPEENPPTFSFAENTKDRLEVRDILTQKWKLALAMNDALKEYHEAALRYRDILKVEPPAKRTLDAVREWFDPPEKPRAPSDFPNSDRERTFSGASAMSTLFTPAHEMERFPTREAMCLHAPANEDPMTKLLNRWGWFTGSFREAHPSGEKKFNITREKYTSTAVTALTMAIALLFLVAAIWVLWVSQQTYITVTMAILTVFVISFASWLGMATNARRPEIFAATAAYSAVLVVFISQGH